MEMWCPDDIGRDSWVWVGPPAWERACFNSPEWGGGSSPVKTEPPQIVLLLLFGEALTHVFVHTRKIRKGARLATNSCTTGGLTPGSITPGVSATPPALDDEELFVIEGSQLRKLALNSGEPEEREKWRKMRQKPLHCRHNPAHAMD